ncbi:MAG: site-specific DNA-methyltransferase [Planctomycetes bacterium]|nr:site-specific DNA-methyltransferase [Planctomycetota bacterium]
MAGRLRIIRASSNPGDLVLDCFIGSGTTAAVAQTHGRRWICADINKGAIQTTSKRLQGIIGEQMEARRKAQPGLPGMKPEDTPPEPTQLGFTVWRVNDYDLAIQHNEAVNLACEKIGVERKKTDPFFEGTLGKSLVKIVPFGHPLTPLDLEEIKRELDARPEEDRPVAVVSLGTEIAALAWVDEWNRLRKGKDAVNRIEVIDLRTDPKHGGFLRHEPAKAKVKIERRKDKVAIQIEDFVSPTIIERLREQAGILQPKIDDWRSMVDCVMVDPAYDGKVFNVALSDVPERKTYLVAGTYEIPAPKGETSVAVKIIDMLGEEVLVTAKI